MSSERHTRVNRLTAEARPPLRAVRMLPQRPDQRERFAAVLGAEQRRRLAAGPDHVGLGGPATLDSSDPFAAAGLTIPASQPDNVKETDTPPTRCRETNKMREDLQESEEVVGSR